MVSGHFIAFDFFKRWASGGVFILMSKKEDLEVGRMQGVLGIIVSALLAEICLLTVDYVYFQSR